MFELEVESRDKQAWRGKAGLCPFIKAENIERLLLSLKTYPFLRNLSSGTVGLPTLVLMRIPQ